MESIILKDSVNVEEESDLLVLEYGQYKVSLDKQNFGSYKSLLPVLKRQITFDELSETLNHQEETLVQLLDRQGFFRYKLGNTVSLLQAKNVFDAIRFEWYRQYYRHPIWEKIRTGQLNRNGLIAWLVHNYHVSRSAGMTDARFYTTTKDISLKRAYKESCLEEYSHCDEFYFVEHPNLDIQESDVQQYIHLPGSLAFDQQMLRMSDKCWLGHVFISYFQEATVKFYDDCKPFYKDVEEVYNLDGFFQRWKQHIELDLDYGHFGHFEEIFSPEKFISKEFLKESLQAAWVTFVHLCRALDQVEQEARKSEKVALRYPVKKGILSSSKTSLLIDANIENAQIDNCTSRMQLWQKLNDVLPSQKAPIKIPIDNKDIEFLKQDIRNLFFRALGFSKTHQATIILGNVIKHNDFEVSETSLYATSASITAISNFLYEVATVTDDFLYLVYHLCNSSLTKFFEIKESSVHSLQMYLENSRLKCQEHTDNLINLTLQLNELINLAADDNLKFNCEDHII